MKPDQRINYYVILELGVLAESNMVFGNIDVNGVEIDFLFLELSSKEIT